MDILKRLHKRMWASAAKRHAGEAVGLLDHVLILLLIPSVTVTSLYVAFVLPVEQRHLVRSIEAWRLNNQGS